MVRLHHIRLPADSMSIAKAMSSAYLPISAVILSPELSEIVEEESGESARSATASPIAPSGASAVALKTIEIYQERRIVDHVRRSRRISRSASVRWPSIR